MRKLILVSLIGLVNSAIIASGDEIKGVVLLKSSNCPIPSLTVEVDPTRGSPQSAVLTATGPDGSFTAKVIGGRYLLVLYQQGTKVYQSEVQVRGTTTKSIFLTPVGGSGAAPCTQAVLHFRPTDNLGRPINDWRPVDLALDTDGSFLVLDSSKRVYRLSHGENGLHSDHLFTLPDEVEPVAIASSGRNIYVTSNSINGCHLYSYIKSTTDQHIQHPLHGICSGIAVDEQKVYVAFSHEETVIPYYTVRVWNENNFQNPDHIDLTEGESVAKGVLPTHPSAAMAVDIHTHELFLGTQGGQLYVVVLGGKPQRIASAGDAISSIGLGTDTLLAVTGGTVRCYTRGVDMLMRKSTSMCIIGHLGGPYTGLVVDASQNVWLTDRVHHDFSGPFPLK